MFFRDKVLEIFEDSLKKKGLSIKERTQEGLYIIDVKDVSLTINLDNVRRDYKRDKDPGRITSFVDGILQSGQPLPSLGEVKSRIRFSAEPSDHNFDGICFEPITQSVSKVIVFSHHDETQITWVAESFLDQWGTSKAQLNEIANDNMNRLLDITEVEVKEVRGMNLAMFSTEYMAFKSSLIFASKFKEKVSSLIGWPVLVVIPARDFVFAFAEMDSDLIPLLGETTIREYNETSYPITKEVIRISDEGIKALGTF